MKHSLKKVFCFVVAIAVISAAAVGFSAGTDMSLKKEVFAARDKSEIILQINNPVMTVDGAEIKIDENGTAPVIINGRTLVPIRAVIEEIGGNVEWDGSLQRTTLNYETINEQK